MAQVQTDSVTGPPLSECVEKYLATREQDLDERTLGQRRLALEHLHRFLDAQGVVLIREVTVDHLATFKAADCRKACGPPRKQPRSQKFVVFSEPLFAAAG